MQIRVVHIRDAALLKILNHHIAREKKRHGGGYRRGGKYVPKLHSVDVVEQVLWAGLTKLRASWLKTVEQKKW